MIKSVCMYPLGEPTRLLDDDNMVREARMQNRPPAFKAVFNYRHHRSE